MPWKKNKGGGYSTAQGGNVKNPSQYEALKEKGFSKESAARITNAKGSGSKRRGK
jgi:hypothetical protein